jgi:hypothetical protein
MALPAQGEIDGFARGAGRVPASSLLGLPAGEFERGRRREAGLDLNWATFRSGLEDAEADFQHVQRLTPGAVLDGGGKALLFGSRSRAMVDAPPASATA